MFYRDEEEDCKAYIPEEDPFFGNNWRGRTEYQPRGTRIQQMFPQSYSTRGRSHNTRQKSSVRVIYDDPLTPDMSKHSNRGKFKQRGRFNAPRNNNSTKQTEIDSNLTEKECVFLKSIENAAIRANVTKSSVENTSQPAQKTKYFAKTKRTFLNNKPNLPENEIFSKQLKYLSQNQPPSIGHPFHTKFQTRGLKNQRNICDNYSFDSYKLTTAPYNTTLPTDYLNFPTHCSNFSSNRFKYPGNGAKFHSNRPSFSSSHFADKYSGPKTTLKVPDSIETASAVHFNQIDSNELKSTTKTESYEATQATKTNSDESKTSTSGSTNSLSETASVDQVSSLSISNDPVSAAGVQVKKKKKHKKKKAVEDIDDLIAKARAIGIIEQKISHKPFVPENRIKNTGKLENNMNVRTLTAAEEKQKILREWQRQQEEMMEMNRKDPITQTQFVGFYGVTLSKNNEDEDEAVIFYGQKTAVKDRARGGCRRGASKSNKGGHSQRQIYEFKFVKERIRRTRRI